MDLYRNAALEAQVGDSADGNELAIDASLVALGSGRYGVVGSSSPTGLGVGGIAGEPTYLYLQSEPGDWVGGGQTALYTPADGTFQLNGAFGGAAELSFSSPTHWWYVDLDAPDAQPLVPGVYTGAPAIRLTGRASLDCRSSGDGRGCNTLTGQFTVFEAAYDGDGRIQSLAATLEQHCEGLPPALYADVWYNSTFTGSPDVDEYTLDLTGKAGQPIDVALAGQIADFAGETLELLAPDGSTVLATAVADPVQPGVPAKNYELGILDFIVPQDGVYTLRLTSSRTAGDYAIVVTEGRTFDTEPNDDALTDPLRGLDGTGGALGYVGRQQA